MYREMIGPGSGFRVVVHITKADKRGQLMVRAGQGTIVGYDSEKAACLEANKLLADFRMIMQLPDEQLPFKTYGVICVVNEDTGAMVQSNVITLSTIEEKIAAMKVRCSELERQLTAQGINVEDLLAKIRQGRI